MTTYWYLNGASLWSTYGTAIARGSYLDIMSPPVPRKRLEHDFTDANGAKVDIISPLKYEPYRYKIKVTITGANFSAFWANFNALLTAIRTPGTFTLQITDIGITVNLLYEGMHCTQKSRSLKSGRVAADYEISVFEKDPTTRSYS